MDDRATVTNKGLKEALSGFVTKTDLRKILDESFSKFGTEFRKDIKDDILTETRIIVKESADDILEVLHDFIDQVDHRFNRLDYKFDRQNSKNNKRFKLIETDVTLLKKAVSS